MAHVQVHREEIEFDEPTLIEGLPGVGLVGKIAADHLVDALDMTYYASCRCEGLPEVAVFGEDDPTYDPPVRIYADEERDLLALQSDVPVSPNVADDFAACLTRWLGERDATALYVSGLPAEKEGVPSLYGVANGDATHLLDDHGIAPPTESGVISGPTGALLYEADRTDLDALGLVVEANRNFPDPEAARVVLLDGVGPIAGVDVDTEHLVEQAEEISQARENLAKRMQESDEESSRAQPMGMYQ
ncbi:proteasome assembly chaperone family protein [Halosimplex pelagicum]|uniref:Proteasome assembly chaperone family protein n=1 Tax=Halosimplex pelagicum TaxID=869886 RepID=A0A7D5PA24_9EURY|nr:PAC2 family protein [Halosimplex pelagicum]QLH84446.1 proteasome assembly chaperone family protein [Halosimplex pelagicum]